MPTSARESRRGSRQEPSSGEAHKSSGDRRQKARSHQIYDGRRRASQQVEKELDVSAERPQGKSRTNSAPLVHTMNEPGRRDTQDDGGRERGNDLKSTHRREQVGPGVGGVDEREVAAVVSGVKKLQPFQNSEVSVPLPDINVAVIGAAGVGKSTFMQNALDVLFPSDSPCVERRIELDGNEYLLRLLEIPIDDIDVDEDDAITWPETIDNRTLPYIHGALALYDITNKSSLEDVPEVLNAINNAAMPLLLLACKCDASSERRRVNPRVVEQSIKRKIKDLDTLRVSASTPETQKECIPLILRAILHGIQANEVERENGSRNHSPSRPRAQSNAVLSLSPRSQKDRGHLRATSEHTGAQHKNQWHSKHDSKLSAYNSSDKLKVHGETSEENMRGSFLIEESASDASSVSSRSCEEADALLVGHSKSKSWVGDEGATFEELVDRLLGQSTSKADNKFVAIFLALYRKFAAPGQLLEATVQRFDNMERRNDPSLIKTMSQLRCLSILEQWVGTYPGDFAYSKTQRRMRTFVGKLSQSRIFSAAAKEISAHLDVVREDDDTEWAYCDRDRTSNNGSFRIDLSSTASILIDDPNFLEGFLLAPTPMEDETKTLVGAEDDTSRSMSSSSLLSQHTANAEIAQKQANLLQPVARQPLSKVHWRALMDLPDEVVARELTRIDWIMFCAIRPRDLVRQVSLTREQKTECKNLIYVNRMIEHFNQLAFWVENFVLLRDKPKHRALMLEKFMKIARKLREMNNYNALGAIIAGVKSSAVHRLAMTRELISPAVGKDWMKLEILMAPSRSYSAYRLAWENSSTERIPYIPLHRRDLVSAEAGNRTFIGDEKDGKVNWKKFEIMGEVVVSIQKAQGVPYTGLPGVKANEQLRELIFDVKLVKDEDELHAHSKQVEPSGTPAVGTTAKFKELFKR